MEERLPPQARSERGVRSRQGPVRSETPSWSLPRSPPPLHVMPHLQIKPFATPIQISNPSPQTAPLKYSERRKGLAVVGLEGHAGSQCRTRIRNSSVSLLEWRQSTWTIPKEKDQDSREDQNKTCLVETRHNPHRLAAVRQQGNLEESLQTLELLSQLHCIGPQTPNSQHTALQVQQTIADITGELEAARLVGKMWAMVARDFRVRCERACPAWWRSRIPIYACLVAVEIRTKSIDATNLLARLLDHRIGGNFFQE